MNGIRSWLARRARSTGAPAPDEHKSPTDVALAPIPEPSAGQPEHIDPSRYVAIPPEPLYLGAEPVPPGFVDHIESVVYRDGGYYYGFARPPGDIEVTHLDGIAWYQAPAPPLDHECWAQTRGWRVLDLVERCACGAIRSTSTSWWTWSEKNARRTK